MKSKSNVRKAQREPSAAKRRRTLASNQSISNVTQLEQAEDRIAKISDCFLRFGIDPLENINHLTALCGELLGATCAIYNRLDHGLLCVWAQWHTPPDFHSISQPEGHLCYDVIRQPQDQAVIIRDLPQSTYAQSDPNVLAYGLQTYFAQAVKLGEVAVGSLCVVYQQDWIPTEDDQRLMNVITSAIAVEEKRKQAEEALKASEQYARSIVDSSLDMIITVDRDRRIVEFNRAAQAIFGYTRDEVLGKHIDLLYADSAEGKLLHQKTFDQGRIIQEVTNRRKNGEIFTSAVSAAIMRDEHGALIGIVGVSRDITEQKRAEEALHESEKRYHDLFENAHDLVYTHDLAGNFTSVNKAVERVTGYTRDEALKLNMSHVVAPEHLESLRLALTPGNLGKGPLVHELEILTKTGRRVPLELSTRLIFKDREPIGVQGIARDITERKRQEEKLLYLSTHDMLTGIYNRGFFEEEIGRFERGRQYPISIVMADVDGLKRTNDTEGHAAGDALLRRTAQVLVAAFRGEDVVARIGGDEFAVLLPCTDAAAAENTLRRVREALAAHNASGQAPLDLSLGIATGDKGSSLNQILKAADDQMYQDKISKPNHTTPRTSL